MIDKMSNIVLQCVHRSAVWWINGQQFHNVHKQLFFLIASGDY